MEDSLIKVDGECKPRQSKMSPKEKQKSNAWAKGAQKPNDQASFHELESAKIGIFQHVGHFFHSFIKHYTFLSKTAKTLMPGQFLPLKTLCPGTEKPNAWAHKSVPTFIRESPPRHKFLVSCLSVNVEITKQ